MATSKSWKTGIGIADKKIADLVDLGLNFSAASANKVANGTTDLTLVSSTAHYSMNYALSVTASPSIQINVQPNGLSAGVTASWAADTSYTITPYLNGVAGGAVSLTPNSTKSGYLVGGYDTSLTLNPTDKISFNDGSRLVLATTLNTPRYNMGGFSNSGVTGYMAGGNNSTPTYYSRIDKLAYSTEAFSISSATISYGTISGAGAMSNSGTAGYFGGGSNASAVNASTVNKVAYSNDSRTALAATLSTARGTQYGYSNSGTAGYIGGWTNWDYLDKFTFSTDTRTSLDTGGNAFMSSSGSLDNSGTAGYAAGIINGSGTFFSTISKTLFSNDARSTLAATLSGIRGHLRGVSNQGVGGYLCGGWNGFNPVNVLSTIDIFTFSNDSRTNSSITISVARGLSAAVSNSGVF